MKDYKRFELQIASIGIEVESSISAELSNRCSLFIKKGITPDVRFMITPGEYESSNYEIINILGSVQIRKKEEEFLKIQYTDDSFRTVRWISRWKKSESTPDRQCLYEVFVPGSIEVIGNINPLMFVELSGFFLRFDAVILHSAVVNYRSQGILFTAPSGTGKSTQADLWETYRGAEIINGDRGIIRRTCAGYYAFGSPYAGSSGIYKNEQVKVSAVVVLRQAEENRIFRLDKKAAYIYLISEISVSEWDKETVEGQAQWLEKFIDCVPVYLLECRPDREAVEVLYKELEAGENKNE